MPFASAQSEHPIAALATGEVVGAVLEAFGERPDLVFISVTRPHAGALDDIIATVDAVLHPLAMIGCAAESVVGTGREVEETPSISLWAGRIGPLLPVSLRAVRSAGDSWAFDGWPEEVSFDPTALILVADPFTFPADQFLAWMEDAHPGLRVVGGNASAALGPGGSRLVVGNRTLHEGAVGVLIGSGVEIELVTSQGCRPYGRPLTVTKSDRNIMYEVAGTPAIESMVEQMKGGLSAEDIGRLENNGLHVGRLIDVHLEEPGPGDYLVRSVIGVDRSTGAMAVDDRIPLGSTVRFHLRDAESADRDLKTILIGHHADGALMFTCNGRGTRLFDESHHDASVLSRQIGPVPVGGFFAAGEIGPVGGRNFVHSFTASIALFTDR
ncbi:MAG TPA: FIST N-terminal domain-containing protein [Acidimicrobiales bacterium]|nr:FIST N-terminal domain-containing protein [Acidimicrobiales bacterium]